MSCHLVACIRREEIQDGKIDGQPLSPAPVLPENKYAGVPREDREFPLTKGALVKRRIGTVQAVNHISFDVRAGECMAIVGESGSGKTTTLLEIMNLEPPADSRIVICGQDASSMNAAQRRAARKNIQMVFQDPISSLNPRMTVKENIQEPLDALGFEGDKDARISDLMRTVGLEAKQLDRFPGHFSGANASASAWPAPWPHTPPSSCWMSRYLRWTSLSRQA